MGGGSYFFAAVVGLYVRFFFCASVRNSFPSELKFFFSKNNLSCRSRRPVTTDRGPIHKLTSRKRRTTNPRNSKMRTSLVSGDAAVGGASGRRRQVRRTWTSRLRERHTGICRKRKRKRRKKTVLTAWNSIDFGYRRTAPVIHLKDDRRIPE